jgi:hypothetical protein
MTVHHWFASLLWFLLWYGIFSSAIRHVHSAWGWSIWAMLLLSGFTLLVNTVDVLFGRWIRRGPRGSVAPYQPLPPPARQQSVIIRRVILEEIETE